MKKPVAKQLPSGAWFCRVRIDGQDYSITRDRKEMAEAEAFAIKTKIKEAQKSRTEKLCPLPSMIILTPAATFYPPPPSGVIKPFSKTVTSL